MNPETPPPTTRDERRALARAVGRSASFSLFLVYCDSPRRAGELLRDLATDLVAAGHDRPLEHLPADLEGVRPAEPEYLGRVEALLRALTSPGEGHGGRVYIVDASRALASENDRWQDFFQRLNTVREAARKQLGGVLVLVMPLWMERAFARSAPDVWSIRAGEFRFEERAAEPAAREPLPAPCDDEPPVTSRAVRERMLRRREAAQEALERGDGAAARSAITDAVNLARRQAAVVDAPLEVIKDLGDVLDLDARVRAASEDWQGTEASLTEAIQRVEMLRQGEDRLEWRAALAARLARRAEARGRLKKTREAVDDYAGAIAHGRDVRERERAAEASTRATTQALIGYLRGLADLHERRGDRGAARAALTEALPLSADPGAEQGRAEIEAHLTRLEAPPPVVPSVEPVPDGRAARVIRAVFAYATWILVLSCVAFIAYEAWVEPGRQKRQWEARESAFIRQRDLFIQACTRLQSVRAPEDRPEMERSVRTEYVRLEALAQGLQHEVERRRCCPCAYMDLPDFPGCGTTRCGTSPDSGFPTADEHRRCGYLRTEMHRVYATMQGSCPLSHRLAPAP